MGQLRSWVGFSVLMALSMVGAAHATNFDGPGSYEITSGPGAGLVVDADAMTDVVDPLVGDNGFIGTGPDCTCAHYHGVLDGLADPAPEGCGWGCVNLLKGDEAPPLTPLGQAVNGISNPVLQATALKLVAGIDAAFKKDCGSGLADGVHALIEELLAGVLSGKISATDAANLGQLAVQLVAIRDALDGVVAAVLKGKPGKKKPKPCSVRLFVRLGSGKNTVLGDPGKRFIIHPGDILRLTAEGMPAGGTYQWSLPVADPGGESSSGDSASFMTFKEGKYTAKVTYTCPTPPGGMATAMFTVVVDGAYLR